MRSKLLVLALAVAVSAGFALSGCKGGGAGAAQELCKKMGEAMGEMAKSAPQGAGAEAQKSGAEFEKECIADYEKAKPEEKEKSAKVVDEILKTCGEKKGMEFMTCIGPLMEKMK